MSNAEIVMVVGGLIAIVMGGVDGLRTDRPSGPPSWTSLGVMVLGIVFVVLAFI